jgi:hypothetical protein
MGAEVTKYGVFDMQVCVPSDWNDEQALAFAQQEYPCGTTNGWLIRREGSKYLNGDAERVPCEKRKGHVHIMLDA